MARGVNKVILVGNLGKDPEVRYMPNGNAIANITLATTDSWKDKQSGEWQEKTEWHRVVAWRYLAEKAERSLRKCKQVYVEGKLETRKWTGKDGNDRCHSVNVHLYILPMWPITSIRRAAPHGVVCSQLPDARSSIHLAANQPPCANTLSHVFVSPELYPVRGPLIY